MAFSSLYAFMNDPNSVNKRRRSDAALKRYDSSEDARAWSLDRQEKSNFIHEIVTRKSGDSSSDDTTIRSPSKLTEAVKNLDVMSKDDLVKQLKMKDVELDKIHKLFKQASKKLEDMNDIIKDNRKFESQLKDSESQMQQLKDNQQEKEEKIKRMNREMEELKCNSSVQMETEQAFNEIKNRATMFDEVVKERNILKNQLCKMIGISDVLQKLKTRADESDQMEQEIAKLKRELQRCGYGAAGDDIPKRRVTSACRQCQKYADELNLRESTLEAEIKKNVETEAERNFLRERVRAIDVMEAELILYKMKQEESECKLMKLKEALIRADMCEKQVYELNQQLAISEKHLIESERHAEELINTIERQEMDLKERDIYVQNLNGRIKQEFVSTSPKSATSNECVPAGKVQTIVQQLSYEPSLTNCKCNFDNCQCANVSKTGSFTLKSSPNPCKSVQKKCCLDRSLNESTNNAMPRKSKTLEEINQLEEELSADEIRLLRRQNAELDQELQNYKCELEKMMRLMNEVEEQRESNGNLEQEVTKLNCSQVKEFENMEKSFCSSISQKEGELCKLQQQLEDEMKKTEQLEKKLAASCQELQELRPLVNHCKTLHEKLGCAEKCVGERSTEVEGLQSDCKTIGEENAQMRKQMQELEIDLEEQRKYAKSLADQLCSRRNQNENPIKEEKPTENREILRKCVKDLKRHYDALKLEKIEMIQCYERKVQQLEAEIESIRCGRDGLAVVKKCECNWSSAEGCGDVLIRKLAKFGLHMMQYGELIDLHNRIRCAMMKLKQSPQVKLNDVPIDYYSKMADELRIKYNLSDVLPSTRNPENIPVKDFDMCSSKTLPSMIPFGNRKTGTREPRARSSEAAVKPRETAEKCVKISRWQPKK